MWSLHTFEQKVKEANPGVRRAADNKRFWHVTTSLEKLWSYLEQNRPALQIIQAISELSLFKREKYYKALKYVIFWYPGNLNVREPQLRAISHTSTFHNNYDPSRGDLIYGIHPGRTHAAYRLRVQHGPNQVWGEEHRYCDKFNNFVGIGKGDAFRGLQNKWFQKTRVDYRVRAAKKEGNAPQFLDAYFDTLMGSRFAPDTVFDVPEGDLAKDDSHSGALIEKQWVKSIRRACKAGILAVATHPTFVSGNARVHFVLDGMGDLGKVARKETKNSNSPYVSITTSELTFCFRKWDLPPLNLKNFVKFYVNTKEVYAPWEQDWTHTDADGAEVKSGYQAWKRYTLYRTLLRIPLLMTHDEEDMGF